MAQSQNGADAEAMHDRKRVLDVLSHVNKQIRRERDFRRFGASSDLDYRISDAHMKALRAEKSALKEILGDL